MSWSHAPQCDDDPCRSRYRVKCRSFLYFCVFSLIQFMHTVLLFIPCAEAHFFVSLGIQSDFCRVPCKECNSGLAFGNPAWYCTVTTWSRRTPMEKFLRSEFYFWRPVCRKIVRLSQIHKSRPQKH